jgi:hypothetical protein
MTYLFVLGAKVLAADNLFENAEQAQGQMLEALGQLQRSAERFNCGRAS